MSRKQRVRDVDCTRKISGRQNIETTLRNHCLSKLKSNNSDRDRFSCTVALRTL